MAYDYIGKLISKNIKVRPIDDYKGAKNKILHKCKCGSTWDATPNSVLMGSTCGCKHHSKTDHKGYLEKLNRNKIKVIPIENYIKSDKKIKHKCICGNEWYVEPAKVLIGNTCGCKKVTNNKTYLEELSKLNIQVEPLEEYKKYQVKIKHKCICGNEWYVEPASILNNRLCGCFKGFNNEEYYKGKATYLYYFKIKGLYKVGVTIKRKNIEKSLKIRYDNKTYKEMELLDYKLFNDGSKAYIKEQKILKENINNKYKGKKILKTGNTELLIEEIKNGL